MYSNFEREISCPDKKFEVLERLHHISGLSETEWQDLLQLNWREYKLVRSGAKPLPTPVVERVAHKFKLEAHEIAEGNIDFQSIQMKADKERRWEMPERYDVAKHGRARTTITSFEYINKYWGWRLRLDTLKALGMSELTLTNEFSPVSIRFISDVLVYLHSRQFQSSDFFKMGAYSYYANTDTIFGKFLSEFKNPQDVLGNMWGDYLQLLEENCIYQFLDLDKNKATLHVVSDPEVAAEMGVVHLGNVHICSLKAGMMASAPCYVGRPMAEVIETQCVHKGDPACLFKINFNNRPDFIH